MALRTAGQRRVAEVLIDGAVALGALDVAGTMVVDQLQVTSSSFLSGLTQIAETEIIGNVLLEGSLDLVQISGVTAVAGVARVYALDDGGKTEVGATFGTGARQQMAQEP